MGLFSFRNWRRKQYSRRDWPNEWNTVLEHHFPVYQQITADFRKHWEEIIQVLHQEKRFEGCGGFEIDDTVRLTILSQAALLLLGNRSDYYYDVRSILVYPDIYTAPVQRREHDSFIVTEGFESRQGEAWSFGNIVLAWDSVIQQTSSFGNGINVTIHEFSHHLDQLYGVSDRIDAPVSDQESDPEWIHKLRKSYLDFVEIVERSHSPFMDPYGAHNPAEFFAVASENFIEKPRALNKHDSSLFDALKTFYEFDPRPLRTQN